MTVPVGLVAHWRSWLGASGAELSALGRASARGPRAPQIVVVGSPRRTAPGWDGVVQLFAGIVDPAGNAVLSVPPAVSGWAEDLLVTGARLDDLRAELPARLGSPGGEVYEAVYRWTTTPAPAGELPDAGAWLPVTDPRVPLWLHPFGGSALVVLEDTDAYLAGVGLKRHDEHVHEVAVGTEEAARGRGLARRLVAQAARGLIERGIVPTYLHDPANTASARVADAAGLPDGGWTALGSADTEQPVA